MQVTKYITQGLRGSPNQVNSLHKAILQGNVQMRSTKTIHVVSCHAEGEVGDVIVGGVAPPDASVEVAAVDTAAAADAAPATPPPPGVAYLDDSGVDEGPTAGDASPRLEDIEI